MAKTQFAWIVSGAVVLPLGVAVGLFLHDHLPEEWAERIGGHSEGGEEEEAGAEVKPEDLEVEVDLDVASVADVPITVPAAGKIEAVADAVLTVSTRASGRIASSSIREGQVVKKGELLARFETAPLDLAVANATAALAEASNKLAEFDRGGREQREAELAAARQKAEADVKVAEARAERQRELAKDGLVAPAVLLEAEQALADSERTAELARRAVTAWSTSGAELERASLVAANAAANAALTDATAVLAAARVEALEDATVVEWKAGVGDSFESGAALGRLTIANGRSVRFELPAADARKLALGALATFHGVGGTDGAGALEGHGRVAALPTRIEPDIGLVDVLVDIEETSATPYLGDVVYGAIEIGKDTGAVTVRKSAVVRADDETVVMVVDEHGIAHRTPVETKEHAGDRIVVTGIHAGDKVIAVGGYNLPDGAKVVAKSEKEGESKEESAKKPATPAPEQGDK